MGPIKANNSLPAFPAPSQCRRMRRLLLRGQLSGTRWMHRCSPTRSPSICRVSRSTTLQRVHLTQGSPRHREPQPLTRGDTGEPEAEPGVGGKDKRPRGKVKPRQALGSSVQCPHPGGSGHYSVQGFSKSSFTSCKSSRKPGRSGQPVGPAH